MPSRILSAEACLAECELANLNRSIDEIRAELLERCPSEKPLKVKRFVPRARMRGGRHSTSPSNPVPITAARRRASRPSSAPESQGCISSTACGSWAFRCASSRVAAASGVPGTGTATLARPATCSPTSTVFHLHPTRTGRASTRPGTRSRPTPSNASTGSACGRTSTMARRCSTVTYGRSNRGSKSTQCRSAWMAKSATLAG